jgi:hypothetical protein
MDLFPTRCDRYAGLIQSFDAYHELQLTYSVNGIRQLSHNFQLPMCDRTLSASLFSVASVLSYTARPKIHFIEIAYLTARDFTRPDFLVSTAGNTLDTHAHTHLFRKCVALYIIMLIS